MNGKSLSFLPFLDDTIKAHLFELVVSTYSTRVMHLDGAESSQREQQIIGLMSFAINIFFFWRFSCCVGSTEQADIPWLNNIKAFVC